MPSVNLEDILLPDQSKQCQNDLNNSPPTPIPPTVSSAADPEQVDIRPRYYDKLSKQWIMFDCGSQVSAIAKSPGDVPTPHLLLEAVDGSILPTYGKKSLSIRMGRKTYQQTVIVTNTTETILGMDFIKANRIDFRWGQ